MIKLISVFLSFFFVATLVAACGRDSSDGSDDTVNEVASSIVAPPAASQPTPSSQPMPSSQAAKRDYSFDDIFDSLKRKDTDEVDEVVTTNVTYGRELGEISIDERILEADVIARVRLRSVEASTRNFLHGPRPLEHVPYADFTFDVLSTLKGSVGALVVVELFCASPGYQGSYETAAEALTDSTACVTDHRDTTWDDREAIVYLWSIDSEDRSITAYKNRPAKVEYTFSGDAYQEGFVLGSDDNYSIKSEKNKVWLPAVSSTGSTGSGQEYYLDDPDADTPTKITLTELISKVNSVVGMVDTTKPGHKKCLLGKLRDERDENLPVTGFAHTQEFNVGSGMSADYALVSFLNSSDQDGYRTYSIEGLDADLFTAERVDSDSNPANGYDVLFKATRPLIKGARTIHLGLQRPDQVVCGYLPHYKTRWVFNVAAPAGTLHELFFDPVTVGTTVAADATNGVLKPSSFTDANDSSATIGGISYESSTVEIEVTPDDALDGHILDIIELDGTVSLSLDVADATVDPSTGSGQAGTLSWSVSSQPWEDGDLLMVRIREAR